MSTPLLPGSLYLFPVPLGESASSDVLPSLNIEWMNNINFYIAENARTARRVFSSSGVKDIREKEILEFNDHTDKKDVIKQFLAYVKTGKNAGLMSEAGCPAVADPGSEIVAAAHEHNIRVIPLIGPSSILLALMGSGMNGQSFVFHGYLPVDKNERVKRIHQLEQNSVKFNQTQIFIETPYRNDKMLADLLATLDPFTKLCIAADLTLNSQYIRTYTVGDWKKRKPEIGKRPAVYLFVASKMTTTTFFV
ncbi:MAG: SAM-dependent methyltransferase [Bacteroidota bacterium]